MLTLHYLKSIFMGATELITRTFRQVMVIALALMCHQALSQRLYQLDRLTIKDGLSQSTVLSICQDSLGYIWAGTRDGLNRYNGHSFKTYRSNADDSSAIFGNVINHIIPGGNGDVWVASDQGLSHYDHSLQRFSNYSLPDGGKEIRVIAYDNTGVLWCGTRWGLFYLDTVSNQISRPDFEIVENSDIQYHAISSFFLDRNDHFWIGTSRYGLYEIDNNGNDITWYNPGDFVKGAETLSRIAAIIADPFDQIWIGTYGEGTFQLSADRSKIHHYKAADNKIIDDHVRAMTIGPEGSVWVGTFQGISILAANTDKSSHITYEEGVLKGLNHGSIRALHTDLKGSIWIGTYFGGINVYDTDNQRFNHYYRIMGNQNTLTHNVTSSFAEVSDHLLAVGTERGGVTWMNRLPDGLLEATGTIDEYTGMTIKSLWADRSGEYLYVGSFKEGLSSYNLDKQEMTRYPRVKEGPFADLSQAIINDMVTEEEETLWIATDGFGGLQKFDLVTKQFQDYPYRSDLSELLGNVTVKDLFLEGDSLWLATLGAGIVLFHLDRGILRHFNQQDGTLPTDEITHIFKDSQGTLWAGTFGEGVIHLNGNDVTKALTTSTGLPNNIVFGSFEDNEHRIWVVTINGLASYSRRYELIETHINASGFPLGEVNEGAFKLLDNGQAMVGGNNGLVIFHPEKLAANEHLAPLHISRLFVRNEEVTPADDTRILKQSIGQTRKITLDYFHNIVTFEYEMLSFHQPENSEYKYQLEGFDEEWVLAGNRRTATYTNLPDDEYIFKVMAANSDGLWIKDPATLIVEVLPPPWKTWWAYIIYAVIIGSSFFLVRYNAMKSAQLKHELKLEQLEKENLERGHELKLKFFTDISHEIRTPLSLIIAPLEGLLDSVKSIEVRESLQTIYNSSRRLMLLVDQLLEIRQIETGHSKISLKSLHLNSFLTKLFNQFKPLADHQQVKLVIDLNIPIGTFLVDQDKTEKILYNLVTNALKFTPARGEIDIQGNTSPGSDGKQNHLKISIRDTGQGMDPETQQRVFERFYKSENSSGAGLGLSLVHSLLEVLGGKLEFISKPDQGTTFTLTLPVKKSEPDNSITEDQIFIRNTPESPNLQVDIIETENPNDIRKKILVIDDNPELRKYLKRHLSERYTVYLSENGKGGFELAHAKDPDLVICDVMMPGIDGMKLCSSIKEDPVISHIPVILLTAKSNETDRLEGLQHGADDYLVKPFMVKELDQRIANTLKNRDRLRTRLRDHGKFSKDGSHLTGYDEKLMSEVMALIHQNIKEPGLSVEFISQHAGLSRAQLYRKLKALTGLSPNDFIRNVKLNKAAEMLMNQKFRVAEVAYHVGFQDINYFGRCFKKRFKCSPTQYVQNRLLLTGKTSE